MKRWISLFLSMLMLLSVAVSCGKSAEEPAETTAQATTSGTTEATVATEVSAETNKYEISDHLPENLNFNGEQIHILSRGRAWCKDVIDVADLTGEVVNDAVYTRNANVEDRLNVKIVDHKDSGTDDAEIIDLMRIQVPAGSSDYDIVCGASYALINSSTENLYHNYLEMDYAGLSERDHNRLLCRSQR